MKKDEIKHVFFSIGYGPLGGYVIVVINEDWQDALNREVKRAKRCKKFGWAKFLVACEPDLKEAYYNDASGITIEKEIDGVSYYAVFLKRFNMEDYMDHVILSHEIVHLCQFKGHKFNRNREIEFEAYTHSYLMRQFYEKYLGK